MEDRQGVANWTSSYVRFLVDYMILLMLARRFHSTRALDGERRAEKQVRQENQCGPDIFRV